MPNKDFTPPLLDEVEVDLIDLVLELKRNIGLILGCALLCLALAAGWVFFVSKPVYTAHGFIRLPSIADWQVNTCAEVLRADQTEESTLSEVSPLVRSFMLRLSFKADTAEQVAEDAKAYLPRAAEKLNRLLREREKADFQMSLLNIIRHDLADIAVRTDAGSSEMERRLVYLTEKIRGLEAGKVFQRVELLSGEPEVVEVLPERRSTLFFGLVCGLIFSCGYVLIRYIIRLSYVERKV